MEGPTSSFLTFYPPHLFKYSPTYTSWARLTAADVHNRLQRRSERSGIVVKDLWYFTNHPIRWVRIVGVIVAFDEWDQRVQITVDDGSGEVIDATAWKTSLRNAESKVQTPPPPNLAGICVNVVVKAKGSIGEFRGRKQLLLKKVEVVNDTADEVLCWKEMVEWKRTVLMKPWVLDSKVVRREGKAWLKEKKRYLEKVQKRGGGGGDDEREGKRVRTEEEDGKKEYRGRRRPEGYVPPPRLRSPSPPLVIIKDRIVGETGHATNVQTTGFRGRRRAVDYIPLPRPQVSRLPSPENAAAERTNDYSDLDSRVQKPSPSPVGMNNSGDLEPDGRDAMKTASTGGSVRTERGNKGGAQECPGRQQPFSDRLSRAWPLLSSSPGPMRERKKRDFADLDFGEPPSSVPASGQRSSDRVVRAKKSAYGTTEVSSTVAGGSFGHRRVRTVPTEKYVPPPLSQPQLTSLTASGEPSSSYRDHWRSGLVPQTLAPQSRTKNRDYKSASLDNDSYALRSLHPTNPPPPPKTYDGYRETPADVYNPLSTQQPPRPQWPAYTGDIPSTISTYYPSPTQPAKPAFRGRRRTPPPPPKPRVLKSAIISHLRSTDAGTTSPQSLLSARSIRALAPPESLLRSAVEALAADGYLLPTKVPDFWVVVGYQQLGDIIDSEEQNAMKRSRDKVVLVQKVWKRAGARGGYWEGVGKEVVGEVVRSHFGSLEGWVEVKGGWEWRGTA